jgi:prophage DNA circulation protein
MADWHDRTGSASFRGVKFHVDAIELEGGRRGPDHEYPFKDDQFAEDMGGVGKSFPVEGYVVGLDYIAQRDKLLEALDKQGPGELVHPTFGTVRVVARKYRVREARGEGGIAKFTIQFSKTIAEPAQPATAVDGAAAVRVSAATATTGIGAEFTAKFQALAGFTASVAGALGAAAAKVDTLVSAVSLETQALAGLKSSISNLSSSAGALAAAPSGLLASVQSLVETMGAAIVASAAANPSAELLKLYDFLPGERPLATTPHGVIEQANFDATQRLVQRLALVQAATAAVGQTFASYEDAVTARLAITDLIDEQAELAADDTYPALQQLRADLIKAVPGDAADLPHLLEHTPASTVPSLVLTYQLYGGLAQEADVLARNHIRHAGFITGGVTLEVLSVPSKSLEKLTDG